MKIVLLLIVLTLFVENATAQDLVYVKQATRAETRAASLAASGQFDWTGNWWMIGPFDASDPTQFNEHAPLPETIDLSATYEGKNGEAAVWREMPFPAGKAHNLKQFKQDENCACYLYREIDSPQDQVTQVGFGSDDGIVVWLNGKQLLANDARRPVGEDQERLALPLVAGRNHLLVKITNAGGNWEFYFGSHASPNMLARLNRRLNHDFPLPGEGAHYRVDELLLPEGESIEVGGMAFRPDGKLLVGTRRGDVWLVSNPLAENPDEITWKPYLRGLHEILGLTLVNGTDLYLTQRPEITLVRDTDGDEEADEFITVNDDFGCSGDYHEYLFGPARDQQGNLFVTLNVGFGGGHQSKVPYRGFCLKVSPDGKLTPWAYGLRSPNGINFAPDGRLYYADNQGEWVATCKLHEIRQNEFYGHMASVRWWPGKKDGDQPAMTPPAIWFPYEMAKSASEPVWDTSGGKFGPFAGQCFMGDQNTSLIARVALEEVQGRMQGACFYFRKDYLSGINRLCFAPDGSLLVGETNRGWGSVGGRPFGLQRVVYTGNLPFEVRTMQITPEGWDLHLTKPVDPLLALEAKSYFLESYTYHHWATYGSPEIDRRQDTMESLRVSADGLTIHMTVPNRDTGRVYHLQIKNLRARDNSELLHGDAYYTLNQLP